MFKSISLSPAPPFCSGILRLNEKRGRTVQLFPYVQMPPIPIEAMSSFTFPGFPQAIGTVSPSGIALLIAGTNLLAGAVVVTLDGVSVIPCNTELDLHAGKIFGVVMEAAEYGKPVRINTSSVVANDSWNWTPGVDVFAGPLGTLSVVPDSGNPVFMQRVGYAVEPGKIKVAVATPIYL